MIPKIFDGKPVVVVAGGPSLRQFDWERLRGLNIISINRAYEHLPFAPVLWWSDARFWRNNREGLTAHPALWKATFDVNYGGECPGTVHRYGFSAVDGFDPRPEFLRTGNNSAYAAMHLAAHLGCRGIMLLLGVDMRHGDNGETHFHSGHRGFLHLETTLSRTMCPHFATLEKPLAERGISVLNASPKSALTVWPRCTIDEGLAAIQQQQSIPEDRLKVASGSR